MADPQRDKQEDEPAVTGQVEKAGGIGYSLVEAARAALGPALLAAKLKRRQAAKAEKAEAGADEKQHEHDQEKVAEAVVEEAKESGGGDVGNVLSWPTLLPHVKRDKKHAIKPKKGKAEVDIPAVDMPELTPDQMKIVEQLRSNREALPEIITAKHKTSSNKGYSYHDSVPKNEKALPSDLEKGGDSRENEVKKIVWSEVRTEGGVDSINTYDSEIVTWGKGFSAKSGSMNEVLELMFKEDPEAEKLLLRAGIAMHGKTWMVVNGATGGVETGDNALRLLQFDPKLLSVFVTLGQDPKHADHAMNAQWKAIAKHAGKVPKYAFSWADDAIRLMAHLCQWMPAYGWEHNSYEGTGGDVWGVVLRFAQIFAKHKGEHKGGGAVAIPRSWDFMMPGHRFYAFAKGVGAEAVKKHAKEVTATEEELKTDGALAGHLLVPIPEQVAGDDKGKHKKKYSYGDKYYDFGGT